MSVTSFIARKNKQKAVYWGTPSNNGRGKYTFAVLAEVNVTWEDEIENFAKDARSRIHIGKDGREFRANAIIYTTEVPTGGWNLDGYILLGELASVNGNMNPYTVSGAHEIKQINTISELNSPNKKLYVIYI